MGIEDKVVLITGATGGLGRVATRLMAAQGARLVLLSRSMARLNELVQSFGMNEARTLVHDADLTNPAAVETAARLVKEKFGKLDVILHLVGGWVGGKVVTDLDPGDVADMLDQHAWTTLHVAQKFLPLMVENQWGRFMVVSAPGATSPGPKGAPYAMGKAAQQALVLTLAQEFKGSGVTANILSVKAIDTDHSGKTGWATPEEIVAAMLYLCSDEARLINGAVIPIYGG